MSAAFRRITSIASRGFQTLSSAMIGTSTSSRSSASASSSRGLSGCSISSGRLGAIALMIWAASFAVRHAMLASTRTLTVSPTAARTAATAATSTSKLWPTLTLTVPKPSAAKALAAVAICSGVPKVIERLKGSRSRTSPPRSV